MYIQNQTLSFNLLVIGGKSLQSLSHSSFLAQLFASCTVFKKLLSKLDFASNYVQKVRFTPYNRHHLRIDRWGQQISLKYQYLSPPNFAFLNFHGPKYKIDHLQQAGALNTSKLHLSLSPNANIDLDEALKLRQ